MKCKKIKIDTINNEVKVLFGLILREDQDWITFKTGNKIHSINKKYILSIEDTTIDFRTETRK
ncbi:MAG: hypothetical protein ABIH25_01280 [Candidatus Woesearchaeota archaeon]